MAIDRDDYKDTEMFSCLAKGCNAYWCKKCSQLAERGVKHSCDGGAEFERYKQQKGVRLCPGKPKKTPSLMKGETLIFMERMWCVN
jgi:hypothetical protein